MRELFTPVRLLAVAVSVMGLGAVGFIMARDGEQVIASDAQFNRDFLDAAFGETQVPLASITDFEWTTVSAFGPVPLSESVSRETGVVLGGAPNMSVEGLLVFCDAGKVVAMREVAMNGVVFSGVATYSDQVLVGPFEPGGLSTFVDPSRFTGGSDCSS